MQKCFDNNHWIMWNFSFIAINTILKIKTVSLLDINTLSYYNKEHTKTELQFSSVTQPCPTLCEPTNHSTAGLPVYHQLQEFTQNHAHRVGDAIQPSYPLSSPSPPAPNPSQHQGLFQWVSSSHKQNLDWLKKWFRNFPGSPVAKILRS